MIDIAQRKSRPPSSILDKAGKKTCSELRRASQFNRLRFFSMRFQAIRSNSAIRDSGEKRIVRITRALGSVPLNELVLGIHSKSGCCLFHLHDSGNKSVREIRALDCDSTSVNALGADWESKRSVGFRGSRQLPRSKYSFRPSGQASLKSISTEIH